MSRLNYHCARLITRVIKALAIKTPTLHRERFDLAGGFVLAPTHESHLEPILLSTLLRRRIDWMARLEFYKYGWSRWLLGRFNCFPVNRFGIPVRAIRSAIHRTTQGKVVGIFPEGGVAKGANSVLHGGRIKLGACLVAVRAGVPVVPVALVGTDVLNRVGPWLPFRRATVWVNFGQPIHPPTGLPRRQARLAMGEELKKAYRALYEELATTYGLEEQAQPAALSS